MMMYPLIGRQVNRWDQCPPWSSDGISKVASGAVMPYCICKSTKLFDVSHNMKAPRGNGGGDVGGSGFHSITITPKRGHQKINTLNCPLHIHPIYNHLSPVHNDHHEIAVYFFFQKVRRSQATRRHSTVRPEAAPRSRRCPLPKSAMAQQKISYKNCVFVMVWEAYNELQTTMHEDQITKFHFRERLRPKIVVYASRHQCAFQRIANTTIDSQLNLIKENPEMVREKYEK